VGYETRESVKDKWSLDIPEKAVQIVNDWGLFQENAEEIHSVLAEIQATSSKAVETVVKQFHSGVRPEDCRQHVREQLLVQYEPACKELKNKHTHLKRKYDQLAESSNECEMMLSLQRRKTKDVYEDNDYLKNRIDSLQSSLLQTEHAHDRLKISYQRQQGELQQSIQREWHYYNQQQRFR
jgi:chromosome segregation ATPase